MFGVGVEEGKITRGILNSPCLCLAYFSREGVKEFWRESAFFPFFKYNTNLLIFLLLLSFWDVLFDFFYNFFIKNWFD